MDPNGQPSSRARRNALLLGIAYAGFISLGLPDALIGIAWPRVRDTFGVAQGAAALIFIGSGVSYFLSSLLTGRLLNRWGVGLLLAISSALVAVSNAGYASAPFWLGFAACSLIHGLGSGAIDAGLNHYVAHHFSARHMNWLHACYSVGATLGPLIMTGAITYFASWRLGYGTVAAILAALSLLFCATRRSWDDPGGEDAHPATTEPATFLQTLKSPITQLQIALFFFYTGLEIALGQWAFTVLTESRHVPSATAGVWVTLYWGSIATGRVVFGFIADAIGLDRLLRWCITAAVIGVGVFAFGFGGAVSEIGLVVAGFSLAPIYPCTMTRTPQRLGAALSAHAIGLQVSAAMIGGAALPSASGLLAQRFGLEVIPWATLTMAVCLLVLHEWLLARDRRRS